MLLLASQTVGALPPEILSEKLFLAYFLGACGTILAMIVAVVTIWDKTRRKPPLGEQLMVLQKSFSENFASKSDVAALSARTDERFDILNSERRVSVAQLHGKIDDLKSTIHREFQDISRALGRLEGDK